jgi:S-adenosylmethionine:tRNA ribosyltransferase-isomerase
MRTADLDYHLPPDLIAQQPADPRDQARLMVCRLRDRRVEHHHVADLPALLRPDDLLVVNDTRVLPARFFATRLATGGKVEGLFLESHDDHTWQLLLQSGGKPRSGERIALAPGHELRLLDRLPDGAWRAEKISPLSTPQLLQAVGSMPLPPYIAPGDDPALHRERYQTVYAATPGAIAAPTAGLHFTAPLLDRLPPRVNVTLHVGLGTFQPVRADDLDDHPMHRESFSVPASTLAAVIQARRDARRIIPVGTTSVRALESLPDPLPDPPADHHGETRLLIQPPHRFRFVDGLMTNFHLPRSTLLALVAALVGLDTLKHFYQTAIDHRYRFYSYGDAMLILPE